MPRPHISYNQVVNWVECPFYHKLDKVDGLVPFRGNLYSAFGRGAHGVPEYAFDEEEITPPPEELELVFQLRFEKELEELEENGYFDSKEWEELLKSSSRFSKTKNLTKDELISQFADIGKHIARWLMSEMKDKYGDFEILGIEEKLKLPIPEFEEYDFLGFIDLIIKIKLTGKIYLIDFKTCSWGWGSGYDEKKRRQEKKSDKLVAYQLMLYKHFYMAKHNITDHSDIETEFILLKRNPGKTSSGELKNPIDFFAVTSGVKKVQNAVNLLKTVAYYVDRRTYFKNRKNCKSFNGYSPCVFWNTEHCNQGFIGSEREKETQNSHIE